MKQLKPVTKQLVDELLDEERTIIKPISVRMADPIIYNRVVAVAEEQDISLNLAVQLLLGYAFNQIDKSGKQFKAKVVFESE